jgi:pyruvate dehydrogenase E1 component alpha subunit
MGHFEGENPMYWEKSEYDSWFGRDPIRRLSQHLIEAGMLDQAKLDAFDQEVLAEIDAAVEFAEQSPLPAAEAALDDIFV